MRHDCANCSRELSAEVASVYDTCDGCFLAIEQVKAGIVELAVPLFDSAWPRSAELLGGGGLRWNWDADFRVPPFLRRLVP